MVNWKKKYMLRFSFRLITTWGKKCRRLDKKWNENIRNELTEIFDKQKQN